MSSRTDIAHGIVKRNVASALKDGDCMCPIHTGIFFFILGLIIARTDSEVGRTLEDALSDPLPDDVAEARGWAEVDQMVANIREELKI